MRRSSHSFDDVGKVFPVSYLGVGDFLGENRLAFASNGDFVRSSAFATGE